MKSRAIAISLLIMTSILATLAVYLFNFEYKPPKVVSTVENTGIAFMKSDKGIAARISATQKMVEGRAFFVRIDITNENNTPVTIVAKECDIEVELHSGKGRQKHSIYAQFASQKGSFPEILPAKHSSYPNPSVSFYADLLSLFKEYEAGPVSIQMVLNLKLDSGEAAIIQSNTINVTVTLGRRQ